jgi:transcriptional regulator with XRE-family HTH domain
MSPAKFAATTPQAASAALHRLAADLGRQIREARVVRRWTTQRLADEAGVSRSLVYQAERGEKVSSEAAVRLAGALGLRVEVQLVDSRRREPQPARQADLVHAAMGELEAGTLRQLTFATAIDDPYQHYQFAGRADVAGWDLDRRALIHFENRTQFPNFQEMAGSFNAKRFYYGSELAARLGIPGWRSETHVIAALWSVETVNALRQQPESFRTLCADPPDAFHAWWRGEPPAAGKTASLTFLDPVALPRERRYIGLEDALAVAPNAPYRGYADAAKRISGAATAR